MRSLAAGLILALFSAPAPTAAKKKGQGRESGSSAISVVFSTTDRRVIVEYCRDGGSGLPPGLAKRGGELPPGLEKQLRRNGRLPPGLEKHLQPFPAALERRLPPLPEGYQRGFIGGRAVLLDPGRGLILDVFVTF
jgi:hypothetical protein